MELYDGQDSGFQAEGHMDDSVERPGLRVPTLPVKILNS